MSALARWFNTKGAKVNGYDKTPTPLTDELQKTGISVHFEENIDAIPKDTQLVVYTPAIPSEHKELSYCKRQDFPVMKRSQVLGLLTKGHYTIAVAGTHGKTTTSSIIAHILKHSGVDCTAFVGGIMTNYNSNVLLSESDDIIVVEADEYDRSFLTIHPNISVITAIDDDHLDIYGNSKNMSQSFVQYAGQVKEGGLLLLKSGLEIISKESQSYSSKEVCDHYATNISIENGEYIFDYLSFSQGIDSIHFSLPGRHNVENAIAAIAVAEELGVKPDDIKKAIACYKGVKRRFEYIIKEDHLVFIDDYAHHPEEIKACVTAVKEMYPKRKVTGIFQPHLFTRTRDFAVDFGKALSGLDEVILIPIYPAREEPIKDVSSDMLLPLIDHANKIFCNKEDLVNKLESENIEVLLTIGAGDIDQLIEPIKRQLLK